MTPPPVALPPADLPDVADLIRLALSGWSPSPLAGLEALLDRVEARR